METRLFEVDPLTGVERLFHYDVENDSFTIEDRQDVTDLIELNKAQYNEVTDRHGRHGEWTRYASIPMNLYMQLCAQGIVQDRDRFAAWLNDRDNLLFRTRPGRV